MTSLLCVSISILLFFILCETHGALTENRQALSSKGKEQVPMFHIQITGKIQKQYTVREHGVGTYTKTTNAHIKTKLTLYKDSEEVAKTHVNWIGGKYKLEAEIPEDEKIGDYELVASNSPYYSQRTTFHVSIDDESPFIDMWDTTIIEKYLRDDNETD